MKRSISRWTLSLATAGVLGLPVTSFALAQAQTPPQQQQPPTQPQPQPTDSTPQSTATATQPSSAQAASPQDHLKQAQAAANDIGATSVPAKDRAALAELKRHLTALEHLGASPSATPSEPARSSEAKPNWGTEVAAIDKIISDMVGTEASTSSTPTPTGTSGTTGSKASSTMIDDATRAKLMEVRTHITAYAAGMAGTPSTPKTEAAASSNPAATEAHSEPSMTPSSSPASSAAPAQSPAAQSAATAQNPPAQNPPTQNPTPPQNPAPTQPDPNAAAGTAQQPSPAAQPQVDAEAAHRHLVSARETLSQLTQLPGATQLSGEARTQVSQLITNFNELIGNPPDWHVSYQKVAANLTTLLGSDNSDAEATAGAPTTATGATAAPGAVGTTGAAELDPAIRAKLLELRRNLNEFQKAAGGAAK